MKHGIFIENIEHGQYVVKTLTSVDDVEDVDDMGGEWGYWLCRYEQSHSPRGKGQFVAVAKFTTQTEVEAFLFGLDKPIVYWPEGD